MRVYTKHLESTPNSLINQQISLETLGVTMGQQRALKAMGRLEHLGQVDNTSYGRSLADLAIKKVTEQINRDLNEDAGKAGKGRKALKLIRLINASESVAMIAVRGAMSCITRKTRTISVIRRIGKNVEDELIARALRDKDDQLYTYLMEAVSRRSEYRYKRRVMMNMIDNNEVRVSPWDSADVVQVGTYLLHVICTATGFFERDIMSNQSEYLVPTPMLIERIDKHKEFLSTLYPVCFPMVVRPRPWKKGMVHGGGYITDALPKIPFIKSKDENDANAAINHDFPVVIAAVNAAQDTKWRIRKPMLDVIMRILESGHSHGILKEFSEMPSPAMPDWGFQHSADRKAVKKAIEAGEKPHLSAQYIKRENEFTLWKKQVVAVKESNVNARSQRSRITCIMDIACKMNHFDHFFIPHQVDFRGRVYPISIMSPQGEDYVKSLMEFAEGEEIGKEGIYWLKHHTSNVWGNDKDTLGGRQSWTDANMPMILACAESPFDNRQWMDADEPFQFLAACFEWQGVMRNGEKHVTHISINFDGTCSGLQNLGMALRCEHTAKAVNLIPQELPSDIYQMVADKVTGVLKGEVHTCQYAQKWLSFVGNNINRKVVKRQAMTFSYGSKVYGFTDQILEDTIRPRKDELRHAVRKGIKSQQEFHDQWYFDNDRKAARYLASHIYDAVCECVLLPAQAMEWLQECARIIVKNNVPVEWVTPLGFPVKQRYYKLNRKRIDTALHGTRYQYSYVERNKEINKTTQANGISPNVVHSLDASHLSLTVYNCLREGIKSFMLVHDSFGTLPSKAGKLFRIIRESFVELYSRDVLQELYEQFVFQAGKKLAAKLPRPPKQGNLDINVTLDAPYSFS
ncbi:DNA-directed RNA polymerase [Vibrio panuliri]|uniref:DNA-directed RNA polymerase n=1 Tax=Vibrio panuliri TaxID=1381081 RepID=A0ABX3FIB1_9VIBR|nr:DNA-directed RNA polymerase [Vibrio panuliri]KAB1460875.1 hypothetical protein F7O85_00425 [Vibrio panuliri]OLQ91680.1 hypothetical protein BIY20_09765 [Vibrio panuliri]